MSFPVAGTLMIEPTESESKTEIDRFVKDHHRGKSRRLKRHSRPPTVRWPTPLIPPVT